MKNFIKAVFLVLLASAFRTVWHIAPNVELVTLATFLSAAYLGWKWAILVPLTIMAITDKSLGTTNIFIFVWSAYLFVGLGDWLVLKKIGKKGLIVKQTMIAFLSSVFFYVFTNVGVWLMDEWGMYTRDLKGLVNCLVMGIPFYRNNFVGNLILVPVGFFIVEKARVWLAKERVAFLKSKE